jgi:hypothetical protein
MPITLSFFLFVIALLAPAWGDDYSDSPEVMRALAQYDVSHQIARKKLDRVLEKTQQDATRAQQLDDALAIQSLREDIQQGMPLAKENDLLRESLKGNRYSWGERFEKKTPISLTFRLAEMRYHSPNRNYERPYFGVGIREIAYGENWVHMLFSPDFQRFILVDNNFAVRTGVCLNPKDGTKKPKALKK